MIHGLLEGLNPPQLEAVTMSYDKDTLVIAGAGSGKTAVLTKRIAFIIANGHSTDSILACTFTNKAADEMRNRVASFVGKDNAKKTLIGTFHSICVVLLRQFGREIGVPKYFNIYDTKDSLQIVRECVQDVLGTTDNEIIKNCRSEISNLKNQLIKSREASIMATSSDEKLVAMVYERYQVKLEKNKSLDFDDLIMKTVDLLKTSTVARSYCNNRFRFVMADEVQDTNAGQFELLGLIAGGNNMFLVGDDAQSIYRFRGAEVGNIINFQEQHPNCRVIKLEQNYRSTQTIVNAGNEVIAHNTVRLDKVCFSDGGLGEKIRTYNAYSDLQECDFVASEINNLITYCGYKYKDISILYRTNALSRGIEDKLMTNGIAYEVVNGLSFYDRKEIKDTMSIMKAINNSDDDIAFKRILGFTPKVGKKTIDRLVEIAEASNISMHASISQYDGRNKSQLLFIADMLEKLYNLKTKPVSELLASTWQLSGYIQRLSAVSSKENEERISNLNELMNVACEFEKRDDKGTLETFLDRMSLSSNRDGETNDDSVKLMTIHSVKGLEFPVVFVIATEEDMLPHKNAKTLFDIEEERRLFYVAITRAERLLYITSSNSRMLYGVKKNTIPSRFLGEISPKYKLEI